jgi:hypothetical protein
MLYTEAVEQWQKHVTVARPVSTGVIMRLYRQALSDGINDELMLLHGLRRGGSQLEGEHSGPMRLIHNCFSDLCDAAIAAAGHEQSMKFITCLGPRWMTKQRETVPVPG